MATTAAAAGRADSPRRLGRGPPPRVPAAGLRSPPPPAPPPVGSRCARRQADLLGLPVLQSPQAESTALGAAFLAGLHVGVWPTLDSLRRLAQEARRFEPKLPAEERERRLALWRKAVRSVIAFYTSEAD